MSSFIRAKPKDVTSRTESSSVKTDDIVFREKDQTRPLSAGPSVSLKPPATSFRSELSGQQGFEFGAFAVDLKKQEIQSLPGLRASAQSGALVVSSGLAELDEALGGGLALCSLTFLVEDRPTSYFDYIIKYFASQGLVHSQPLVYISSGLLHKIHRSVEPSLDRREHEPDRFELIDGHPELQLFDKKEPKGSIKAEANLPEGESESQRAIRIAWRYKQLAESTSRGAVAAATSTSTDTKISAPFVNEFDIGGSSGFDLRNSAKTLLPGSTPLVLDADLLSPDSILDELQRFLRRSVGRNQPANAVRVVIRSLSKLFVSCSKQQAKCETGTVCLSGSPSVLVFDESSLLGFICNLRALVRRSNAVVLLSDSPSDSKVWKRVQHLVDNVLVVDSNRGFGTQSLGLGDYLGTLNVAKVAAHPRSLKSSARDLNQRSTETVFVFHRTKRRFVLQPAAAAPEPDVVDYDKAKPRAKCAPTGGSSTAIDF